MHKEIAYTITKEPKPIGLTEVPGFKASGVACDIRNNGSDQLDLALVYSSEACNAAAVFTTNDIKAAPVYYCAQQLHKNRSFHGFVVNSGNANAATGAQGMRDAQDMAECAAQACHTTKDSFFSSSTGHIGSLLPMDKIRHGIEQASRSLGTKKEHAQHAASAILTSDTRTKLSTVRITGKDKTITLSGMAKGAGMIEPNMATMLAYIVSDVDASNQTLHPLLQKAVQHSFNAITVDGDMSTNDTVLLLTNSNSGHSINNDPELQKAFQHALNYLCEDLSLQIIMDGEGVSKAIRLIVEGAQDKAAAEKVARAVGNSMLVKSSWFGNDPNWGRIMDAVGYARVGVDLNCMSSYYSDGIGERRAEPPEHLVPTVLKGVPQFDCENEWRKIVEKRNFTIVINLGMGSAKYILMSTDLSEAYVDFNKSE